MTIELLRFVGGALVLMIPGVLLAAQLCKGDRLQRWTCGACLGLALAVFIASAVSLFDLRWFYPAWIVVAAIAAIRFRKQTSPRGIAFENSLACDPHPNPPPEYMGRGKEGGLMPISDCPETSPPVDRGLIVVLLIVAVSRYAIALPQTLPKGWDPTFHMILAGKIQRSQHAISDWTPFEPVTLNYPTGSHTLLVVLSDLSGLPLQTVFKDLIPLLGVLTAAQISVLARRLTADAAAGCFAALAYGMWANAGSIGYYDWGGLPNELAMLLFLSMLCVWLDDAPQRRAIAAMAVFYAATILVHHHVMLVSAALLPVIVACSPWRAAGRKLAIAVLIAVVLDAFFLIPYAAKAATLASTKVLHHGESPVDLLDVLWSMGIVYILAAAAGIVIWRRSVILAAIVLTLIGMYAACEYGWPAWLAAHGQARSTAFTPSRFVGDLNSFLAVYAEAAVAWIQRKLRWPTTAMIAIMLAAAVSQIGLWRSMARGAGVSPDFVEACQWVQDHTPPDCAVISRENWATYLTWRRTGSTPMPDSEPVQSAHSQFMAPEIVTIIDASANPGWPVFWKAGNVEVARIKP
jgi:hypothetical protein